MIKEVFRKTLYELVCECVEKDQDTFILKADKYIFLCMLKHFFTIHDCSDFYEQDIMNLESYNKFYRESVRLYCSDERIKSIEKYVINEEYEDGEEDEDELSFE